MNAYLEAHLRVFGVADFSDDPVAFMTAMLGYSANISWDYYDVRRQRLAMLARFFPNHADDIRSISADYYVNGEEQLIRLFLDQMDAIQIKAFHAIVPFRKRAHASFRVELSNGLIQRLPDAEFVMPGDWNGDFRTLPRVFKPVCLGIGSDAHFVALLSFISGQVKQRQPRAQQLTVNLHFMSVFVSGDQRDTNSPEGIHQDGADYIVSALVLDRRNVSGGMSRIYVGKEKDKTCPDLSITLQPGQGVFQSDAGSRLWHDVSPVTVEEHSRQGVRSILGLDVSVN